MTLQIDIADQNELKELRYLLSFGNEAIYQTPSQYLSPEEKRMSAKVYHKVYNQLKKYEKD